MWVRGAGMWENVNPSGACLVSVSCVGVGRTVLCPAGLPAVPGAGEGRAGSWEQPEQMGGAARVLAQPALLSVVPLLPSLGRGGCVSRTSVGSPGR